MNRYLVMAMRLPQFDTGQIGPHRDFLDDLRRQGRLELAGGFSDKSGGAYVLRASDIDEARVLAFTDPLHLTGSSRVDVFEWQAA
ncbi:YciI family protein [Lysobacter sp. BMK333-48F3]|uniref:YciI family protein n=1 Tax=Lysobacter sp. BMK333-48F3 TaxID=2867962 RepID=UPI001C8CA7A9|nr:YciI family protein [Lysobacter sp. BMK333-48F3]MBX9401363.1 YciI family protein [Lysobacter sp. BMK333-48F3]